MHILEVCDIVKIMNEKEIRDYGKFLGKLGYGERTCEEYIREILAFLKWLKEIGSPPPEASVYRKYLEHLKRRNKKPKTISKHLSALKSFSKFLHLTKKTKKNEALFISHPILKVREKKILGDQEIKRLRNIASQNSLTTALFETLLQTGMTISETASLKNGQVIFVKGPKYGGIKVKNRVVPINNRLEEILQKHFKTNLTNKPNGYVFPSRSGKHINVRYIRTLLDKVFRKSGLHDFYVNDLRHNFVYQQLLKRVDPATVAYWVGFKNLSSLNPFLKRLGKIAPEESVIGEI